MRFFFALMTVMLIGAGCTDSLSVSQTGQSTKEEVRVSIASTSDKSDQQEYIVDLFTGTRTLAEDEQQLDWSSFSGIAPDVESDSVWTTYNPVYDPTKSRAIVRVTSYDISNGESDFGGFPVFTYVDYLCDVDTRTCELTTILLDAEAAAKPTVNFYRWDPDSHRMFGHPAGEGVGDMNVAYIYDYEIGTLTKTADLLGAYVPPVYDSPYQRVAVFSDDESRKLLVYDTRDLSQSTQTISLDVFASNDQVRRMAWSPDNGTIIIETVKRIYAIDTDTGTVTRLVEDTTMKREFLSYKTGFVFSPNGELIVYVDGRETEDVLVTVNITSGETKEILRDTYLFISHSE